LIFEGNFYGVPPTPFARERSRQRGSCLFRYVIEQTLRNLDACLPSQQLHQHAYSTAATAWPFDDADQSCQRTLLHSHPIAFAEYREHAHDAVRTGAQSQKIDHLIVDARWRIAETHQAMHSRSPDDIPVLQLEVHTGEEIPRKKRLHDIVERDSRRMDDPRKECAHAATGELPLRILFLADLRMNNVPTLAIVLEHAVFPFRMAA